jgi:hypothetical protein
VAAGEAERSAEKNKGENFGDGPMGEVCGFGGREKFLLLKTKS